MKRLHLKILKIILVGGNYTDAEEIKKILAPTWIFKWVPSEKLKEALTQLKKKSFNITFFYLSLPDASSWNILKQLKAAAPDIPIVVIGESDDTAIAIQCIRKGAQEYCVKREINQTSLTRVIYCAIERRRQQISKVEENELEILQRSKQQLQAILDYAPAVIYIKDLKGRYLLVNRYCETLFNTDKKAFQGKTDFDLFPQEIAEKLCKNDQEVLAKNSAIQVEEIITQADGLHTYISSKFPLRDAATGKPYAVAGISIDITALKKAEAESEQFFNTSLDMLCIVGFDGYFKRINPVWEKTLGYSKEEILSKQFIELIHPEDRENTLKEIQKLSAGSGTVDFENRYRCKDGSYRWLTWKSVPFVQEGLIYAIASDISDRKAAEIEKIQLIESLQKSEARHRALLDAIPDMMFRCSADGTYIDFKPAKGIKPLIPPSLFIGKKITEVLPPELAEKVMEAHTKALSTEKTQILEYQLEKDGETRYYEARIVAVKRYNESIAIIRDITKRKQAEIALLAANERLQLAIESTKLGLWDWDIRTGETYFSPQWKAMLGYEENEIKNNYLSWERLIHPEDLPHVIETIRACIESRFPLYEIEFRMKNKSGGWQWILAHGKIFLRDESGTPLRMIGTHKDITARKMAEEFLKQQLKRERLLNTMQERIRSSLNLQEVLTTAVEEVRQFLQVERALIYRFNQDWSGKIIVESVEKGWQSLAGINIPEKCFAEKCVSLYEKGSIYASADINESELNHCYFSFFDQFQVRAKLILPIWLGENLWGMLVVHQCSGSRHWQEYEIASLQNFGVQLALAIQQCTLFEQAQTEIAERRLAEEALRLSEAREREKAAQLKATLQKLSSAQAQLVQNEKMASLGQLVAGIAHEINNPISFIYGNINYAHQYASELIRLVQLYQKYYPEPVQSIQKEIEEIELDFIKEDFFNLLQSMREGAKRIREIVQALRSFSRLDESVLKAVNIHEGIDSTLLILQNRLKDTRKRPEIKVIKEYGDLPLVECYAGDLNQVFMNLILNAIDALEEKSVQRGVCNGKVKETEELVALNLTQNNEAMLLQETKYPTIRIRTKLLQGDRVSISIADNGPGIPSEIQSRIFDPFFTTKPVGSGTGLGLSISYQIVKKHGGNLNFFSTPGKGAEFIIELPVQQKASLVKV
ncbi:MAG: PAS domain S-box protein [Oscillatoriaceae bacterium SKYG93]|nr:PAS domain S-box protein [Oscillatoriaceae bacterium SKYG93]MDW8454662.1 PAS domain S-box protein [Oscillatoriaceae cyanobacterium SKYGB_i_bin93]